MTIKKTAAIFASAFLVAIIALPLVACGGGGGGEETPTPTNIPRTNCKPAGPVVPITPTDLPPGISEYQSPERGYRVRYPSDWAVQPNQIGVGNLAGDVFFAPAAVGDVKPNLSVACETLPIGTTTDQFVQSKLDVIQKLYGESPSVEETLTVNGNDASLIRYKVTGQQTPEPLTVDKIDVLFADDLGGWTLTLVAPEGAADTYKSTLDAFVESFQRP
jgi:hypothetical protein